MNVTAVSGQNTQSSTAGRACGHRCAAAFAETNNALQEPLVEVRLVCFVAGVENTGQILVAVARFTGKQTDTTVQGVVFVVCNGDADIGQRICIVGCKCRHGQLCTVFGVFTEDGVEGQTVSDRIITGQAVVKCGRIFKPRDHVNTAGILTGVTTFVFECKVGDLTFRLEHQNTVRARRMKVDFGCFWLFPGGFHSDRSFLRENMLVIV